MGERRSSDQQAIRMKPFVSVISVTFRPGLDIFLAGMRDQSYPNFEVIVSDRRYERRHERVMAMSREYGVNLIHVPEHRRNGKWVSFCSAWNTATAVARGDLLIFCQDWAYCPQGYIESHVRAQDGRWNRYVIAPYCYTELPPIEWKERVDLTGQWGRGDRCVEWDRMLLGGAIDELTPFVGGPFDPDCLAELPPLKHPDQDSRQWKHGPGVPETYAHIKNESCAQSLFYAMNGLDERMERGKGPMDTEFTARLAESGVEFFWEPSASHVAPNARSLIRTMPWGALHERLEGRWSWDDGLKYVERRRMETRLGQPRALNPYDILDLAKQLEPWRTAETIDVSGLDVPDEVYWGEKHPVWPETP